MRKKTRRTPKRYPTVALHPRLPVCRAPARRSAEPTYGRWQRWRWLLKATWEMLDLYRKNLFGPWK